MIRTVILESRPLRFATAIATPVVLERRLFLIEYSEKRRTYYTPKCIPVTNYDSVISHRDS